MSLTADAIIAHLQLQPHPEGGAYREIHRSAATVHHPAHGSPRNALTAIYFLLRAGDFSAWHRVESDEVWNVYTGALELLLLSPGGALSIHMLGADLLAGQRPQHIVPAGWYQAARPAPGVPHVLCGCAVAPGFDFADFHMPTRGEMLAILRAHPELAAALTRTPA